VTDVAGIARVGSWTLGSVAGANALRAAVPADTVTFAATAQPAEYDVGIRYFGAELPTTDQEAAFTAAAAQWEQLIVGDLADVPMTLVPVAPW